MHEAGRRDAGHLADVRDRRDVPPAAARALRPRAAALRAPVTSSISATCCSEGPGAEEQWLHRDEAVWSDVPRPHPELQLATVIAFVDFTRENGATRVVPGSHRWPDRQLVPAEQMLQSPPAPEQIAYAEMPAGSAVIYSGGTIHAGGANSTSIPRRGAHLSYCLGWLRTEENNYLSTPPAVAATLPRRAQELLGYALHDSIPRGGGYLGMVRMQDPVELLARGEL